jgi:putative addiction module killer protein
MIEIRKTDLFVQWLDTLHDLQARARVQARIERLAAGNPGDVEPVGEGVSELRINYGPGYRVYFKKRGRELIILLAGGNKGTQAKTSRWPCASRVIFRSSNHDQDRYHSL